MYKYYVIEGEHIDPMNKDTIQQSTSITHGHFDTEEKAVEIQKSLIMKKSDNYYHRAWIVKVDV